MKRLIVRMIILLLTFFIGVSAVALWLVLRRPVSSEPEHACPQSAEKRSSLKDVFYDFEFVGAGLPSSQIPSHGLAAQPVPEKFEVGHQYVFHRCVATDNDWLFEELSSRLRHGGFNIPSAKKIGWGYVDGLQFQISFKDETYKGRIRNVLDEQIAVDRDKSPGRCFVDDYILIIEE